MEFDGMSRKTSKLGLRNGIRISDHRFAIIMVIGESVSGNSGSKQDNYLIVCFRPHFPEIPFL